MGFYSTIDYQPDVSVGYLAKRVYQLAQAGLDAMLAAEGLSYMQWQALVSVHFGRGGTCVALARELAYDKGATTRLIDVLEGKGLVRRVRGGADRRIIALELTPAGEETARRCRLKVIGAWNGWLEGWSHDDVGEAIALLQRLRATLEEKLA